MPPYGWSGAPRYHAPYSNPSSQQQHQQLYSPNAGGGRGGGGRGGRRGDSGGGRSGRRDSGDGRGGRRGDSGGRRDSGNRGGGANTNGSGGLRKTKSDPSVVSSSGNNSTTRHRSTKTASEFTIDLDAVRSGEEKRRTIMVRNIPNRYTREVLLDDLQEFIGMFDFFYLPMDLSAHSNVGYAFINFAKADDLISFYLKFHKQKWRRHKSQKICEIAFGRLQGKNELISQFRERNNRVTIPKNYQPICFYVDGPNRGGIETEAFTFTKDTTTTSLAETETETAAAPVAVPAAAPSASPIVRNKKGAAAATGAGLGGEQ